MNKYHEREATIGGLFRIRAGGIGTARFFTATTLFALLLLHQLRFVAEEGHVEAVGVFFGDLQLVDPDPLLLDLNGPTKDIFGALAFQYGENVAVGAQFLQF